MTLTQSYYDKLGKQVLSELFKQLGTPHTFTSYEFDRVDVYFGRSSVGEVKYRLKKYDDFLIEENKVDALTRNPASSKYYIVVVDNEIWFWRLSTIRNFLPYRAELPTSPERTEYRIKTVRKLPCSAADFHFVKDAQNKPWRLVKLN